MSDEKAPRPDGQPQMQFHVAQDLDYVYRDLVNILLGPADIVLELGTVHRAMPGHATIANRIVMPMAVADDLQRRLAAALQEARARLQQLQGQQGRQ